MTWTARLDRAAWTASRALAVLGGLVLVALIVMVCASVTGRTTGLGPVTGDYELIELGTGFAVFAFLPWCQISGGHARVDLLTHRLGPRAERGLDALWSVLMAVALAVIAWRVGAGLAGKLASGETTFLRQIPVWWGYAAVMPAAVLAAVVALWGAIRSMQRIGGAP